MARSAAIGLQRLRQIALRHLHVADLLVGDREVALPAGVAGVGLASRSVIARLPDRTSAPPAGRPAPPARRRPCCTRPRDRAASRRCRDRTWPAARRSRGCLIGLQRRRQIALRHLHVADLARSDTERSRCQPALPGSAFASRSAMARLVPVGLQRRRRGRPAPPARRRPCRRTPRDRAASRRCRGRLSPAARRSRGSPDRTSAPPAGCPARPARRRPCRTRPRDRAASRRCRGRLGQPLGDREARPDRTSAPPAGCPAPPARRRPCRTNREIALPAGVAGVGFRQTVG